jgi:hypothetical protein
VKVRLRTMFAVTTPAPLLNGRRLGAPTTWFGDCPQWAASHTRDGVTVTRTRVRWVGKSWPCHCTPGAHA